MPKELLCEKYGGTLYKGHVVTESNYKLKWPTEKVVSAMTVVNAAVVTVLSVVLLIYIFITVAIVAKHVIVDTCAVLKKNVIVVKVTIGMMEIRLQIDEITMKIVCLRPGVMVMRNAWLCIVIITSIKCNGV